MVHRIKIFPVICLLSFLVLPCCPGVIAQFAPGAGEEGTTAIHMDSELFVDWAISCEVKRGYVNIADTTYSHENSVFASFGVPENAIGKANGSVVSLGDGGWAIVTFNHPLVNKEGHDFAVFENSFDGKFLELAFVEVSSDGIRFVRFPSVSLTGTETQVRTFDLLDPEKIHNLAGKYMLGYGTPFDLADLKDSSGIDIDHITHVKIIDVIGSIDGEYASFDSQGNKINDPWPTPFFSGGFDLDAVGVIHNTHSVNIRKYNSNVNDAISVYPNPANDYVNIHAEGLVIATLGIYDQFGRMLQLINNVNDMSGVDLTGFCSGTYILKVTTEENNIFFTRIIKH